MVNRYGALVGTLGIGKSSAESCATSLTICKHFKNNWLCLPTSFKYLKGLFFSEGLNNDNQSDVLLDVTPKIIFQSDQHFSCIRKFLCGSK